MEPFGGVSGRIGVSKSQADLHFTAGGISTGSTSTDQTWAMFGQMTPSTSTGADMGSQYQQELQAVQDKYKATYGKLLAQVAKYEAELIDTRAALSSSRKEVERRDSDLLATQQKITVSTKDAVDLAEAQQMLLQCQRAYSQVDNQQKDTQDALTWTTDMMQQYKQQWESASKQLLEAQATTDSLKSELARSNEYSRMQEADLRQQWAATIPESPDLTQGASANQLVLYLLKEVQHSREQAAEAERKLKARGGASVVDLEREVLRLRSERDRWLEDTQTLAKQKAEIGQLHVQIDMAKQTELEKQHLEVRCSELENVLSQKERIISDLKNSLFFFQSEARQNNQGSNSVTLEQSSVYTSSEQGNTIRNLQELLNKFKNDYMFLHNEYVALRSRFGLDGSIPAVETQLKKAQSQNNQVSTIQPEQSQMMLEAVPEQEKQETGQEVSADNQFLNVLPVLFSWLIEYHQEKQTVNCTWPSNSDYFMQYQIEEGKILLSQGLESLLLEEAPELLSSEDTLALYIANITLLLSSQAQPTN